MATNRPGEVRIVGAKFLDTDGNGVQDPGEAQRAGWPIFLDDNGNGQWDGSESLTYTNSWGEFALLDIERRSHLVAEGTPFGFRQTAPAPFHDPIDIPSLGEVSTTASGDLNGDGRLDLVVPNSDETIVLLNQGGGRFEESARLPGTGGVWDVAVDDFNGDQILDLAVTHVHLDGVGVWIGNGDGTFDSLPSQVTPNATLFPVGQQPHGILAANLVGDNSIDLVTVNLLSADITILAGRGDGRFDTHSRWSTGSVGVTESVVTGDFDDDSNIDLAIANGQTEEITLLWSDGSGGFTVDTRIVPGIESSIVAGQFNTGLTGDQHLDLAVAANGAIVVRHGDGQREFPDVRVIPTGGIFPSSLAATDFDQDGHTDLVTSVRSNDSVAFFRQEETIDLGVLRSNFVPAGSLPVADDPRHISTGLFDADGFADLVVAATDDELVQVLTGNPFRHHRIRAGELRIHDQPFVMFGNHVRDGGEIQGEVWMDLDADGVRDLSTPTSPADPRLPGQMIYIDLNDNGVLDVGRVEPYQFSDAQGRYSFPGLPAGDYTLRTILTPFWAQTFPSGAWSVTVPARQTVGNIDFGIAPPGEIRGTLYHDTNLNGQQDVGEPPLAGWEVILSSHGSGRGGRRLTDVDGTYVFADLPAGSYNVSQTVPDGWTATAMTTVDLAQAEIRDLSFGNHGALRLVGNLWEDLNANGIVDLGEGPRAGEFAFVDRNQNSQFDPGEIGAQADALGDYELLVPPGTHWVTQTLPENPQYVQTFPASRARVLTVDRNSPIGPYDFGSRIPADIRGFVRIDQDGDGILDPGEPGRAGATVYQDTNGNDRFDIGEPTAVTDSSGEYVFLNQSVAQGHIGLLAEEPWLQVNPLAEPDKFNISLLSVYPETLAQLNPLTDQYPDFVEIDHRMPFRPAKIVYNLNTGPARTPGPGGTVALPNTFESSQEQGNAIHAHISDVAYVEHVNSDGNPDFLAIDVEGNVISFLVSFGDGMGDFTPTAIPLSPSIAISSPAGATDSGLDEIELTHVNRATDQIPDLVVRQLVVYGRIPETRRLTILGRRDASGKLVFDTQPSVVVEASRPPSSPELVGDLNGDGQDEHLVRLGASYAPVLEFQTPQGLVLDRIDLTHPIHNLIVSDLDQDGDLDIVVGGGRHYDDDSDEIPLYVVTFLTGDGTGRFTKESRLFPGGELFGRSELVQDLDGDGRTDLLLAGGHLLLATDNIAAHSTYRVGNQAFQHGVLLDLYLSEERRAEDFDLDGWIDLLRSECTANSPTTCDTVIRYGPLFRPGTVPGNGSFDFLVAQMPDADSDGVSSRTEDIAPGGGDGNSDGRDDRDQANVASLPNAVDGSYITIAAPSGTQLVNVRVEANPHPASTPTGVQFPFGFVSFELTGFDPADPHVTVDIISHGSAPTNSFYKFGPTPARPADHFYSFSLGAIPPAVCANLASCVGAFVAGNTTTLYLTDGLLGDSDLTVNGRIVDPGGPAVIVQPMLQVAGATAGVRGQPLEWQFNVTPPGNYTYEIDWDGDGSTDESLNGSDTMTVEHVFGIEGDQAVQVTATGADGVPSDPVTHDVSVDIAVVIGGDLWVGGTGGNDRVYFDGRSQHELEVHLNGSLLGPFVLTAGARLVAFGGTGDDHLEASVNLHRNVVFHGGPGSDTLYGAQGDDLLEGGPGVDYLIGRGGDDLLDGGDDDDLLHGVEGNNILIGAAGNDHLISGLGQDMLIGGAGADVLLGWFAEDILVTGTTSYDDDRDSLRLLLAEWVRPLPFATRVRTLSDSSRPLYLKKEETVLDDDSVDWLFGGLESNWSFFDPMQDLGFR